MSLQCLAKGEQESSGCHGRRATGAEGAHRGECSNATAIRNELCCCTESCAWWNNRDVSISRTPHRYLGGSAGMWGSLTGLCLYPTALLQLGKAELPLPNTLLLVGTAAGHGLWAVMGLLWGCSTMALGLPWAAMGYTHGTSSIAPN